MGGENDEKGSLVSGSNCAGAPGSKSEFDRQGMAIVREK